MNVLYYGVIGAACGLLVAQLAPVAALVWLLAASLVRCAVSGLAGLPRAIGRGIVQPTWETAKIALLVAAVAAYGISIANHEPAPGDSRLLQWLTQR